MNTVLFNKNLVNTNDDIPGNSLLLLLGPLLLPVIVVVDDTPYSLLNSASSS